MEKNLKHIEELLVRLLEKLDYIKSGRQINVQPRFYRNKDLKRIFGLSSNTIIKYRDSGILPYTFMGDIYLYPVSEIDFILNQNSTALVIGNKKGEHHV